MILDIALGIVLAVIILSLLPLILAFGVIALVLAVVAAIAFWLFPSWGSFLTVIAIPALAYTVADVAEHLAPRFRLARQVHSLICRLKNFILAENDEKQRRRDLGYDDQPHEKDSA